MLSANLLQTIVIFHILVCAAALFSWDDNEDDDDDDNDAPKPFANVDTTTGPIRGQLQHTIIDHLPYYSFKGIPYAESTAFEQRFLPPLPKEPWSERRDCFAFGNVCPQHDPLNKTRLIGDEDCLFLNVYTPHRPSDRNGAALLTVMVYIHGGGFFFGSGNDGLLGPDLLLNRRHLLVVTLNYRLGVLGFMSLGTPQYSGNQGLKDQQLALRWLRDNIERFGGDPDRVTIFGQSAGSSSCYFHTMAPQSRGLFQQTIQMSFTFDIWSVFERGDHLDEMYEFSRTQRYNATHYADLVAFLRTVDAGQIVAAHPIVQYHPDRTPIVISSKWLPVVENSAAWQPFMQHTPTQLLLMDRFDADVSVMAGYTTSEALFYATPNCLRPETLNAFDADFQIELPSMHFNRAFNSTAYRKVAAQIRRRYFPGGVRVNQNGETLRAFVQLMSHVYQNYQIDRRVRLLARKTSGSVFMYRFGLLSALNYYRNRLGAQNLPGAAHADDVCYVFRCRYIDAVYANATRASTTYRNIETMTGLYANFAKYGDPGLGPRDADDDGRKRLKRSSGGRLNYVDITDDGLRVGVNPLAEEMEFWARVVRDNPALMTHDVDQCVDLVIGALLSGE